MNDRRDPREREARTSRLKRLLLSPQIEFLMEAHNGLSARIVQEAGFDGIWASGLSISASLGVRDNNEASWTQVLEVLEYMSDASSLPILVDGDTGYGNFNNVRRLVKKLEPRGIAGLCIEDKLFPKKNSFIAGETQALAEIEEFQGKIKAAKDAQSDADFCLVARVEAFIAGLGLAEALKRAEAYRQAGADAVLIHSKKSDPSDIEAFMREWAGRAPVVIVPTRYYSTPTERFRELGVSLVIWANHVLRASITAMQATARQIRKDESVQGVEDRIAPLKEVFRLQGEEELQAAERLYLPVAREPARAIILAASRGAELFELTARRPKAMIEVAGQPILVRQIAELAALGIQPITVVRGFAKEQIAGPGFLTVDNDRHETTGDLWSLHLARESLAGHCLVTYGDTLFRRHLATDALNAPGDLVVVVDAERKRDGKRRDHARCSRRYTHDFQHQDVRLVGLASGTDPQGADGEWTGILATRGEGTALLAREVAELAGRPDGPSLSLVHALDGLARRVPITVVYTRGGWLDVDDATDIEQAGGFYA